MSSESSLPILKLSILLSIGVFAVSSSAILIRLADAPGLSVAFWRATFSIALLAPFWFTKKRWKKVASLTRNQHIQLVMAGLCLGIHLWSWIVSLSYTSVAASVLLVTTNPLWVALLSPWVLKEYPSKQTWLGIGIAMCGTFIVAFDHSGGSKSNPLLGNTLALIGAFAASGYLLSGRKVRPFLDIWSYASITIVGAWVVLLLGMVTTGGVFTGFTYKDWLLFFAIAAFPQMVGHNSLNWSLRYLRAETVAVILLAEPIGSAILAGLVFLEFPGYGVLAGGPALLVGILIVLLDAKKNTKNPTKEQAKEVQVQQQ